MLTLLAALAASSAFIVLGARGASARRLTVEPMHSQPTRQRLPLLAVAACAGSTMLMLLVGVAGALVAVAAVALMLASRLRRTSARPLDCALTIDVLAGCLSAGAPMPEAIMAAACAAPFELRQGLSGVAQALTTGAPPQEAWSTVAGSSAAMAATARVCARGMGSGSAIAAELNSVAARERRRRRTGRQQRINRASVWAVLPLGLCFLPAFVLVGVVPLVAGLLPMAR